MPLMPRFPKLVRPMSMSPAAVLRAAGQTEKDVVSALILEPLAALGLKLPAPPSVGETAAGILSQVPGLPGSGRTKTQTTERETGHNPWPGRQITLVEGKDLIETGVGPPATPSGIRYMK